MNLSPDLMSKFMQIIDYDIKVIGLLAEIAEDIDDPALRDILTSIIGDENGHIKFFRLLLLLTGNDNSLRTSRVHQCAEVEETLHPEPLGVTPLSSADNPAVDITVSKENPSHYQTHDFETEEKNMNRPPLNQRKVPLRGWRKRKPKKISLDISQLS